MENVLLTQSRFKTFCLYSKTQDIIFSFLLFDKMPQMYKWSNNHDLDGKHKQHGTSKKFSRVAYCFRFYISAFY